MSQNIQFPPNSDVIHGPDDDQHGQRNPVPPFE